MFLMCVMNINEMNQCGGGGVGSSNEIGYCGFVFVI